MTGIFPLACKQEIIGLAGAGCGGCGLHRNSKVIWSSMQVCKADKIEHDNSSFLLFDNY